MIHFTKLTSPSPFELQLSNTRLNKSNTVKYFGLMFDPKLDWKADIQQLKSSLIVIVL